MNEKTLYINLDAFCKQSSRLTPKGQMHLSMFQEDFEKLVAKFKEYKVALEEIKRDCGRVCGEFMECTHASCNSSYTAWAIADKALKTDEDYEDECSHCGK